MSEKEQIVIYQTNDSASSIEVHVKDETVWLNRNQLATLFDRDVKTIGKHITNVFKEGELDKPATVAKYATVQIEGGREIKRDVEHYSLDVIISVGYRVKSKRGTQFRIWANTILKKYLKKGYALNERLLKEKTQQLHELKHVIKLQEKVLSEYYLASGETKGLINIIANYSKALDILDDYDHQRLQLPEKGSKQVFQINYNEAREAINQLGKQTNSGDLFGREKDDSFKGSLQNIFQTFGHKDVYKTTEEKAAHLLYFVVKNHSFTDGNKRIAAFLFVWFLDRNKLLYNSPDSKRISGNTLVALTLMIAESNPEDKDLMIKITVNLLVNHE